MQTPIYSVALVPQRCVEYLRLWQLWWSLPVLSTGFGESVPNLFPSILRKLLEEVQSLSLSFILWLNMKNASDITSFLRFLKVVQLFQMASFDSRALGLWDAFLLFPPVEARLLHGVGSLSLLHCVSGCKKPLL